MIEKPASIVPPPNNVPYIIAVVMMMAIACGGAVAILIWRPDHDNSLVIGSIFGFLTTTTLSLLAFMKAQETHLSVNSRLDAFIRNAQLAAMAEGVTRGRQEGRVTADARTDALASNQKGDLP